MQNLRENCAENVLKLCANWAEKSAENRRKIARKLRVNVLWLRTCDEKFFTVLFKKYSTVIVVQLSSFCNA